MEFKLRKFFEPTDLKIINGWLFEHKHSLVKPIDIPLIGFICQYGSNPIAAGFLRQMEGPTGMIDGLASNPKAPGVHRHVAIDLVVKKLIKEARKKRLKTIVSYSIDEGTLKRATRHGFVQLPHKVIALEIKNYQR